MYTKILGVFSDIIAILLVWVNNSICCGLKILITIISFLLAVGFFLLEKGPYEAKVIDYFKDDNGIIKSVFIKTNTNFQANSLVSIYYHQHKQKHLTAIGYVLDNKDGDLQVLIIKKINTYIDCISNSTKSFKDFAVTPIMMYSETENLFVKSKEGD